MGNRLKETYADRTDELVRRISKAQTPQEFQDALDDMAVHLTAQREIATIAENVAIHDVTHEHVT